MRKPATLRVSLGLLITAALLVGSGVVGAGAATGPKLKVTPSTNLKNNEKIKVSGTGFKAGDTVYVVECLVTAKGAAGCNELGATPATVSASFDVPSSIGTGASVLEVVANGIASAPVSVTVSASGLRTR